MKFDIGDTVKRKLKSVKCIYVTSVDYKDRDIYNKYFICDISYEDESIYYQENERLMRNSIDYILSTRRSYSYVNYSIDYIHCKKLLTERV